MKLNINLGERSYPIYMEPGILEHMSEYVNLNRKVMIFADENVPSCFADTVKAQCKDAYIRILPSGETTKSAEMWKECLSELLKKEFGRNDLIVAIGGGVTGDLAGFVAASYMRGISFVNVPTTTLSQIDSSIGGKTAINMDGVKNCVGAFHQPIAVFLDSMTLQSLPERHYRNGMVEALKAGFIQDPVILDLMEEDVYKNESEIILRSLQMKKKIVEEDETEQGIRKILNFGHTIGHGIESYFDCKDVLHGEAVAVGMDKLLTGDNKKRLRRILDSLKIPYNLSYDTDKVLEYMLKDKKRTADTLTLVKVYTAGEAVLETVKVSELKNLL